MQLDYDSYGADAFEYSIILECNEAEARKQECIYIEIFNCVNNGYNAVSNKKNYFLLQKKELEYIQSFLSETDYEPDGNYYIFDIFEFSNKIHTTPTKLMHSLGLDSDKQFPVYKRYDDVLIVGLDVIFGELSVIISSTIEIETPEFYYLNERNTYGNQERKPAAQTGRT